MAATEMEGAAMEGNVQEDEESPDTPSGAQCQSHFYFSSLGLSPSAKQAQDTLGIFLFLGCAFL